MANASIDIVFYVSSGGAPLTGAAAEMNFQSLAAIDGTDKSAAAPAVTEIGGGWYKFSVAYGIDPFDAGNLVGVIDADKDGNNSLSNADRYIPVKACLENFALMRLVGNMSQNKADGAMLIQNDSGQTVLKLSITEDSETVSRTPGADD